MEFTYFPPVNKQHSSTPEISINTASLKAKETLLQTASDSPALSLLKGPPSYELLTLSCHREAGAGVAPQAPKATPCRVKSQPAPQLLLHDTPILIRIHKLSLPAEKLDTTKPDSYPVATTVFFALMRWMDPSSMHRAIMPRHSPFSIRRSKAKYSTK